MVRKFFIAVFQGFTQKTVLALTVLLACCLYDNTVTCEAIGPGGDTIATVFVWIASQAIAPAAGLDVAGAGRAERAVPGISVAAGVRKSPGIHRGGTDAFPNI